MKMLICNCTRAALLLVVASLLMTRHAASESLHPVENDIISLNAMWDDASQARYYALAREVANVAIHDSQDPTGARILMNELLSRWPDAAHIGDSDINIMRDLADHLLGQTYTNRHHVESVAEIVAQFMGRIRLERDPEFVDLPVFLTVPPPTEIDQFFHSGMTPEMIKDNHARKQFIRAIDDNEQRARINMRQRALNLTNSVFFPKLKEFLVNARLRGSISDEQLESLMLTAELNEAEKSQIAKSILFQQTRRQVERGRDRMNAEKSSELD